MPGKRILAESFGFECLHCDFYKHASFVFPLCIIVYCYGHILVVIRRRAKVFGGDNAASDTFRSSALRAQINVIKMTLAIVAFLVLSWIPGEVYSLLNVIYYNSENNAWLAIISLAFVNVCVDPFIYAAQYNVIKSRIRQLVTSVQAATIQTIE